MIYDFVSELKNDDEALAIISAFGFSLRDWSFIERVGGALKVISSDLMRTFIAEKVHIRPYMGPFLKDVRLQFDRFYESGGFLVSPLTQLSSRLFKYPQSPLIFYGRYNQDVLSKTPAVAIVGSRSASHFALNLTRELSSILAKENINVVSGGAIGIDQAAHLGALHALGTTIIVSGVACNFSEDHTKKFGNVDGDRLAVIYPFGPFNPQGKFMFIERNRFVVSLADVLVIVQGKIGSGTLHTAAFAETLKIPIYAIPGAVNDPLSYAPNFVLETRCGKALVNFEQFAKSLVPKSDNLPKRRVIAGKQNIKNNEILLELPYILQMISDHENALSFDELLKLTGLPFADLQKQLLQYELSGRVMKQGAQFVLTGC
jgi:DNA processing protein